MVVGNWKLERWVGWQLRRNCVAATAVQRGDWTLCSAHTLLPRQGFPPRGLLIPLPLFVAPQAAESCLSRFGIEVRRPTQRSSVLSRPRLYQILVSCLWVKAQRIAPCAWDAQQTWRVLCSGLYSTLQTVNARSVDCRFRIWKKKPSSLL